MECVLSRPIDGIGVQPLADWQPVEQFEIILGRGRIHGEALITYPRLACNDHGNSHGCQFHAGFCPIDNYSVAVLTENIGTNLAVRRYDVNIVRQGRINLADFIHKRLP